MADTLQIVSIIATIGTAILFSGLFSAELFIWYQISVEQSGNFTHISVGNTGPMQAKDAILFITSSKQPDTVTMDCLEGHLISSTKNQNITQISFERISTGVNCKIDLHGINKNSINDIVITSDDRSAYRPNSYGIFYFYLVLAVLILIELLGMFQAIPFWLDYALPIGLSFKYRKNQNSKTIQAKIKSEFGIKLFLIDIEILKKIDSGKKTILQISTQLKLPPSIVQRRLKLLTKYELTSEMKVLDKIVQIIDSTPQFNTQNS